MRTLTFDTLTSTNDYLKERLDSFDEAVCIQAKHQTQGRGQRGRIWKAEDGENLLITLYHPAVVTNERAIWISTLAIVECLKRYNVDSNIKLPNDILVNNRKIAGILIEHLTSKQKIITGIGLNVNETFTDVLLSATSLSQLTNRQYEIEKVREQLLDIYQSLILKDEKTLLKQFKTILFKKKIMGFQDDKSVEIIDIDENLNCKVDDQWVSCETLEFVPPIER